MRRLLLNSMFCLTLIFAGSCAFLQQEVPQLPHSSFRRPSDVDDIWDRPLTIFKCIVSKCSDVASSRQLECSFSECIQRQRNHNRRRVSESELETLNPITAWEEEEEDEAAGGGRGGAYARRRAMDINTNANNNNDVILTDKSLKRTKKWKYSDLLQVCITTHCQGQRGAPFYQCVFKRCIQV